jgi:glyoxylase-like metal-dependent hydrolase (beta-lactamase superfamily II)
MLLRLHILDTGYCLASEHHILRGGARRTVACHALVALLHHSQHGWLLWDTGYAPRLIEVTRSFPYRFYRWLTPLAIDPQEAAVAQIARFGLRPEDISTIVLSHFHADHIAGLRDYPAARFVASAAAYQDVEQLDGLAALRRGFIPALLPADFATRARLIADFNGPALPGLDATHDLFGDSSLLLVELPGHARGQIGLLAETARGSVFFVADGAWQRRAIVEQGPPHPITHSIVADVAAMHATLAGLREFSLARPDVIIMPSHCPEALAELLY